MTKEATAKIHHATMNRAIKEGVKLDVVKGGKFAAIHDESGKKATANTAKDALDKVLKLVNVNEDDEGSEDGEEGSGLIVVKDKYKKKYAPNGGNCGDKLAQALTTIRARADINGFDTVCRENKLAPKQWGGKNKGLKWMALSNTLRARVKRNEEVSVDGTAIKSL